MLLHRPLATLAALVAVSALAGCSGTNNGTAADPNGQGGTSAAPATDSSAPSTESSAPSAGSSGAAGTCTYPTDGAAPAKPVDPPPGEPTVSGDVPVTIKTNVGDLKATLDAATTPCTVNSFVSLADQGYYDGTPCHRLTTAGIFVLQCGDPTGTGSGGPGYAFPDELTGKETYPAGTLAMANAGPDTNGSQFFIVYKNTPLPPSYAVFGTVDAAAVKVVQKVAKAGSDNTFGQGDGAPNTPVQLTGVTVDN